MSYESRAYDKPNTGTGFGPDPVVVLVVEGTHDVSRLVNLFAGGPVLVEQLEVGERIRNQVRRHAGGRAALQLLAEHGGPDFTGPPVPKLSDTELRIVQALVDGSTSGQIAAKLEVVPHAVAMRLGRARKKAGVDTTAQLVALCVHLGLVEPGGAE